MILQKKLVGIMVILILACSQFPQQTGQTNQAPVNSFTPSQTFDNPATTFNDVNFNTVNSFQNAAQNTNFNAPVDDGSLSFGTFQQQVQNPTSTLPPINSQFSNGQFTNQQTSSTSVSGIPTQQQAPPAPPPAPVEFVTEMGQPIVGKGLKSNNGFSFQKIKLGKLTKKYLFLDLKMSQRDTWQKVNMTINLERSQIPIQTCFYDGTDNCYLNSGVLPPNAVIVITIQCQDDCSYSLNTRQTDIQLLRPGDQSTFKFGQDITQIYHVRLENEQFEEFRVHIKPRVTRKPFENIKLYGKYGADSNPTEKDYDFVSVNLWQDGQGLFLTRQEMKQKTFNLLMVGQAESTYEMSCKLVEDKVHQIDLGEHVYEYMNKGDSQTYKIDVTQDDFKAYDEFSFKFSTLSGENEVKYYSDAQLKNELPIQPYQYMKDTQFLLPKKDIVQANKTSATLYIKVSTSSRASTFTIKAVGRNDKQAIQLNQHIYGFVPLVNQRLVYFNFKRWLEQKQEKSSLKFTLYMISIMGDITPEFRVCTSALASCIHPTLYKQNSEPIKPLKHDQVSGKQIWDFEIGQSKLTPLNSVQEHMNIIVNLKSANKQQRAFAVLEVVNNNKILYLRQGRPLQQKLAVDETKSYKYINSDPDVSEVRIHFNEIAGKISIRGASLSQNAQLPASHSNTLHFTKNLLQPIVIAVKAQDPAIFVLYMQVIHKSSVHNDTSLITISQDLTYTARIQPSSYVVFQVVPIFYDFQFGFQSTQSVIACALDFTTNKCQVTDDPNNTSPSLPRFQTKGQITDISLFQRKAHIKVANPFSNSVAQVRVIFHSRSFNRCARRQIGSIFSQIVQNGTCFSYLLTDHSEDDVEIYVSKRQLGSLGFSITVCGNSIQKSMSKKIIKITGKQINDVCAKSIQSKEINIVWNIPANTQDTSPSIHVDFAVQYQGGIALLPEGVSYTVREVARPGFVRKFAFKVLNKKKTTIVLNQISGRFQMFAKIVRQSEKQKAIISQINYQYAHTYTKVFSQEPIIHIPEEDLKNAKCDECAILIAVKGQDFDQGKTIEYSVEVVQIYETLTQNSVKNGFVEPGSMAYYVYDARHQQKVTLVFVRSDHNQQCANMYLGLVEFPGPQSSIASSKGDQVLAYPHSSGQARYFLTIEGITRCEYTISILTSQTQIIPMQRSKQQLIRIPKDTVALFTFENLAEPFKILSVLKYGQLNMYIDKFDKKQKLSSLAPRANQVEKFAYRGQSNNLLAVSERNRIFCTNCDYLVAVKGAQRTQGVLFLVYPSTIVPISQGRFFSDQILQKDGYTMASYSHIGKTNIEVTVHKGVLHIIALYKDIIVEQTFNARQGPQTMYVDMTQADKVKIPIPEADPNLGQKVDEKKQADFIPMNLVMRAQAEGTVYRLVITNIDNDLTQNVAYYQSIVAGQPNHVSFSNLKVLCLKGYFRDSLEEIIISSNYNQYQLLQSLKLQGKISGVQVGISPKLTGNILAVNFNKPTNITTSGASFQICGLLNLTAELKEKYMKIQEQQASLTKEQKQGQVPVPQKPKTQDITEALVKTLNITDVPEQIVLQAIASQSNQVNLVASDSSIPVHGQQTFVLHAQGDLVLDVRKCTGESSIKIGNSIKQLDKVRSRSFDMLTQNQPHAIHVIAHATTDTSAFVQIKAQSALFRWMPVNYQRDIGTGYNKFKAGQIQYHSDFKVVKIQYQKLQSVKPTKASVKDIQYFVIISNSIEEMQETANCQNMANRNILVKQLDQPNTFSDYNQKDYHSFNLQKSTIEQKFGKSQNIYFTIVVKLVLEVEKKDEKFVRASANQNEHYLFIYNRQQLPMQAYQQGQIQSIPYHWLFALVFAIAAVFLMIVLVCTRKIIPMIARLRQGSSLVEDPEPEPRNDDMEVPPSSDRNQIGPENNLQTEEKMGR